MAAMKHVYDSPFLVHGLMFVSATLVSTSFIVGEHIAPTLDPAALTLLRFALATLLFTPLITRRFSVRITFQAFLRYGAISGCLVAFFWCMFLALRFTSALHTSVLFTVVPAISACYAYVFLKERLDTNRKAALMLGLFGAIWVIFRGDIHLLASLAWNKGDVIFFLGCLAMGFYTPLVKLLYRNEPMEVMTYWVMFTGMVWLLPIGGHALLEVSWREVPVNTWLLIAYLSVFTTIITFYLTQLATPVIGPTRTMSYSYLYPALVLSMDIMLGKELPPLRVLPGVILILGAMVVLQTGRRTGDGHD